MTAARLPVGDTRRLIRALEVCEYTGRPFSEVARVDESREVNYNAATFVLTCPRPLLYQRVEERVDVMIAGGWVDEVAGLRAAGLTLEHQSLQAIGYRHLYHWLEQGGSLDETMALIKRDTRRYAKRQLTWFRREPGVFLEWGEGLSFAGALEVMSDHASRLTGR